MKRAHVVTPWTGNGTAAASYRPQLAVTYALTSWMDVTGQAPANIPPSPNLFTVEIVCADAVLTQIAGDVNYSIVWSEPA
jgi:hypothetical protein